MVMVNPNLGRVGTRYYLRSSSFKHIGPAVSFVRVSLCIAVRPTSFRYHVHLTPSVRHLLTVSLEIKRGRLYKEACIKKLENF